MDMLNKTGNIDVDGIVLGLHRIFGSIDTKTASALGDTPAALGITKIANIKLIREKTGLDLATSKAFLDWLCALVMGPSSSNDLMSQVNLLKSDLGHVQAERDRAERARERVEKDLVEAHQERDYESAKSKAILSLVNAARGCLDATDRL